MFDPTVPCFEQSCPTGPGFSGATQTTEDFIDSVPDRLAKDPGEARTVQDEAVARASLLATRGDLAGARNVLLGTGDALTDTGKLEDAKKVYTELTRPPLANGKLNLAQGLLAQSDGTSENHADTKAHNKLSLSVASFDTTTGKLGELKLAQLETQGKMEKVLGRSVDPRNPDEARAYFQAYAGAHSNAEVATEYQGYLKAFYKHAGGGVDWDKSIPMDERGKRVGELLEGQQPDTAGRAVVDCEGYSYLTEHVLGGLTDAQGDERFKVLYASRQLHVITGVVDTKRQELFTVNNAEVSAPKKFKEDVDAINLLGHSLVEQGTCIFGVGTSQSKSEVQSNDDHYSPPKVNSFVWDSKTGGVVGVINEQMSREYIEYSRTKGLGSEGYGGFLDWYVARHQR